MVKFPSSLKLQSPGGSSRWSWHMIIYKVKGALARCIPKPFDNASKVEDTHVEASSGSGRSVLFEDDDHHCSACELS